MIIYADELFIINFISYFSILYVFAAFAELERHKIAIAIAAIAGSALATVRFCLGWSNTLFVLLELLIPIIAFRKITFLNIALFGVIKLIITGITTMAISSFGTVNSLIRGGIIYMKINPLLFLSVFIVVYPLLNLTLWLIKRYRHKRRIYTLIINGARVKALYDSGNTLINPYNQNGVIIIEKGYLNFDEDEGFMLIPYTALNHNAFIKGYRTTNIFCVEKNLKIKDVTIGISNDALSKSGEYAALIGPAIFKE